MIKPQMPTYNYGISNYGKNFYSSNKALNNESAPATNSGRDSRSIMVNQQPQATSRSPSRLVKASTSRPSPTRLVYGTANTSMQNNTYNSMTNASTNFNQNNFAVSSTNFNYDMIPTMGGQKPQQQQSYQQVRGNGNAVEATGSVYDNMDNDMLVARMISNVQQMRPVAVTSSDFRITLPGATNEVTRLTTVQKVDMNLEVELFEPSPYNIMSDPVIAEQFRRLYEEDEYFRAIHRKCCEWLTKYVFPEMERERAKKNT
jgi:hypothetical protein